MKILYIDTTSKYLYTALSEDGKITGEIKSKLDKDLSVFTLSKIKEVLDSRNLKPNDIDKLIVVNGPGSFTGIRIGVTIGKTYAYSLNKDIVSASTLEVMALSSRKETMYKVPIIDARRGYVFAGIYDANNAVILKEQYLKLDTLKCTLENLPGDYSIITNDNIDIENKEEYDPNFESIINHFSNHEGVNPHSLNPNYLKLTEAEEKQQVEII